MEGSDDESWDVGRKKERVKVGAGNVPFWREGGGGGGAVWGLTRMRANGVRWSARGGGGGGGGGGTDAQHCHCRALATHAEEVHSTAPCSQRPSSTRQVAQVWHRQKCEL